MRDVERKVIGIDEKLSFGKSLFYGFQSVIALNLFLAAIIIASALQMDIASTAIMLTLSFFAMGIATCIQAGLFMKYPVVQGVSFATLGSIIAVSVKHDVATAFGSLFLGAVLIIIAGYFKIFSKIVKLFIPPIIAGVVIIVIGISLMPMCLTNIVSSPGNTGKNFAEAAITFILIIAFMIIGNSKIRVSNFFGRGAVLYAIILGTIFASITGSVDYSPVANASWFALPHLFYFGLPKFELSSSLIMVFIFFIVMVETIGNWFAISNTAETELKDKSINRGIIGEGIGCLIGAIVGSGPPTSYATNCGVIAVTKVYSRWAAVASGGIIVVLSFCPKLMNLIAVIPGPVMWGTLGAMAIMILVSGLRAIHPFELDDRNIILVGVPVFVTICVAILPSGIIAGMPEILSYLFSSSLAVGVLVAVIANIIIPKPKTKAAIREPEVEEKEA